ncbi:hypothetical protein [Limnobacter alexandrii]|jgi:hypothetical protein|uniref:hypothetical protein n=1 Tax=Limnobacter alexandrii TaxID=2570352 RepID=UPI001107D8C5|nr:hypothetical protein [Limnobacter alexandrii]
MNVNNDDELHFKELTVSKHDLTVLERVIQKHLDKLMENYQSEYHDDLVIAGLSRIMLALGKRINIDRDSSGRGYLVEIVDEK